MPSPTRRRPGTASPRAAAKRAPRAKADDAGPPNTGARADATTRYARDVVAGRIVAGPWVRLACERHLRDIERDDLTWDRASAERAIGFFRDVLCLNGGNFEGKPFLLSPWQAFIVGSLFGWKTPDGYRRFRVAYVEIGKGNGKSPLAAGIGHYMLCADGEARAEVYAAATKKDQAMILFRDAVAMREQSPALRNRLKPSGAAPNVWNLADLKTGSFYRPIASDDGQSGPRPHCGLIDELHEHKSGTVVDMMRAGTKGRTQALIFEITNSGFDRHSVCRQHHDYSTNVLQGIYPDDSWFAYVCALDVCERCKSNGIRAKDCTACDDWKDEAVWPKANPNLGISVTLKYLREQVREAIGMPAKQNVVRRLNLCEWTEQDSRSIPMDLWDLGAAPIDRAGLRGRACYGGMDLGRVGDLSSVELLFPPVQPLEPWKVLSFFWCPKDDIHLRTEKDGVPYEVWARDEMIVPTHGNVTDFSFIKARVVELAGEFNLLGIGYDRTFAGEIVQDLQDEGILMVQVGQGFLSMAAPTAELHRLVKAWGQEPEPDKPPPIGLQHGGHPVLRWNAGNLSVAIDPAGNMKPDKEHSAERIDGISALCNALGLAMTQEKPDTTGSHYDTQPLFVL